MLNHNPRPCLSAAILLGIGLSSLPLLSMELGAQSKPCVSKNWGGKLRNRTSTASKFAFRASNGPRTLAFDGLEFFTRARSTAQTVTVSIWSAKGPMNGGTLLARGSMSMGTTLRAYKATFAKAAVVPANSAFWIQFDRAASIYMPTVLPGSTLTHYYNYLGRWYGPYSGTWNYRLFCKDLAEVSAYGKGCVGAKPGCVPSKSYNWTQPLGSATTAAKKIGIMEFAVGGTDPVCGLSLRCKAKSKATTVTVSAHDISWVGSKSVPGKLLGTSTMKVGTTASIYTANFPSAFSPPTSGSVMFVLDQTDQIVLPTTSKGDTGFHVEFDGKAWSTMKWNLNWTYRLHRSPAARIPLVGSSGFPILGKQFSVLLSQARPSTGSLFFLGISKTNWGALPLPLDLKVIGAPGCLLLTSTDLALAVSTDSKGNAQMNVNVPNMSSLVGKHFYNQFLIYDPGANSLNMVASNAGDAKAGRY